MRAWRIVRRGQAVAYGKAPAERQTDQDQNLMQELQVPAARSDSILGSTVQPVSRAQAAPGMVGAFLAGSG